jgi:hypothetical protein
MPGEDQGGSYAGAATWTLRLNCPVIPRRLPAAISKQEPHGFSPSAGS